MVTTPSRRSLVTPKALRPHDSRILSGPYGFLQKQLAPSVGIITKCHIALPPERHSTREAYHLRGIPPETCHPRGIPPTHGGRPTSKLMQGGQPKASSMQA
ncbi:hypothetical protein ACLB2K_015592 [Fragaria x ananassa]